ncbi:MAG: Gfo/Idh/MocA family oxidoreductase [Candidatus Poribacteria bacterium]
MASLKIGHVDLDTSHPQSWIPIIRELGHEVVGVFDGGTIYPQGYAKEFAGNNNIPQVFDSLDEMANAVDVAIIHSCNWDLHIQRAEPFINAGKSVLIDKPMIGNLKDAQKLKEWTNQGARITGGSSIRFAYEVKNLLSIPIAERGEIHTIFAGCAVDEFNYGIHAYSLLSGIGGEGVESVQFIGSGVQRLIYVNWRDGKKGILSVGKQAGYLPFYATVVTDKKLFNIQVDSGKVYKALLEAVLPYLGKETDSPPVSLPNLIETELIAIAARMSWMKNGDRIFLEDLRLDDAGYDGLAFGEEYRIAKVKAR